MFLILVFTVLSFFLGNFNVLSCDCVRHYQCINGFIKNDGRNVVIWRYSNGKCRKGQVCCRLPNNLNLGNSTNLKKPMINNPNQGSSGVRDESSASTDDGEQSSFQCGVSSQSVDLKISGNDEDTSTNAGDFPWTLLIKYQHYLKNGTVGAQEFLGAATLVLPSVVITAAHIIEGKDFKNLIIRAGEWDFSVDFEPAQDRTVRLVKIHPEYERDPIKYDIAVIILERPFDKNDAVNSLCLPGHDVKLDKNSCYATGWGAKSQSSTPSGNQVLSKARIKLISRELCQSKLRKTELGAAYYLHRSFVCAGGYDNIDTCKGDGGGPLACISKDRPYKFFLAGITSWGVGCGHKGIPGVYTNVLALSDWVTSEVLPLLKSGVIYK